MTSYLRSSRGLGVALKKTQVYRLPVLPFLYDTVTIRRFYNDGSRGKDRVSADSSRGDSEGRSYWPRDGQSFKDNDRTRPYVDRRNRPDTDSRRRPHPEDRFPRRPNRDAELKSDPFDLEDSPWASDLQSYKNADTYRQHQHLDSNVARSREGNADSNPWPSRTRKVAARPLTTSRARPVAVEEEDIPFDDPNLVAKADIPEASTVTDQERKAFERLRALGAAATRSKAGTKAGTTTRATKATAAASAPAPEKPGLDMLDDVLEEAMVNVENEAQAFVHETAVPAMRTHEIQRIIGLFKSAKTDFELWTILKTEVLDPIAALNLDSPKKKDNTEVKGTRDALLNRQVEPMDREVIMHNFPFLLSGACRSLQNLFPSSPLVLMVIPTIKDMGPSVYALGASTKLYNHAIGFVFDKLSDIDRINDLLQEMETEVIEPDAVTLRMLDKIMMTWQQIRRGAFGDAVRVTWKMERFKKALNLLEKSRNQMEASLARQEARKTRKWLQTVGSEVE